MVSCKNGGDAAEKTDATKQVSIDEKNILDLINQVAEDKKFNTQSYSKTLDSLSPKCVARIAVLANTLYTGDTENLKEDEKWGSLFLMCKNHIVNRKDASYEELLYAIDYIRRFTFVDGGDFLMLQEMEDAITQKMKAQAKP